jgi:integrase
VHYPATAAADLRPHHELIETPWSEIDFDKGEWIIPQQRMKRGKLTVNSETTNHHVCLSRQALALPRELHAVTSGSTYLFPNQRDPKKPIGNNAILVKLECMGYKGRMTGHGFRALAMSTIRGAWAIDTKSWTASWHMRQETRSLVPTTVLSSSPSARR